MHEGWDNDKNAPILGILTKLADFWRIFTLFSGLVQLFLICFFRLYSWVQPGRLDSNKPAFQDEKISTLKRDFKILKHDSQIVRGLGKLWNFG